MDNEMMRALEADGEKLRHLTGEDHGPHFAEVSEEYVQTSDKTLHEMLTGKAASPLPWKVSVEEDWNGEDSFWIEAADGNRVADQIDYYPTAVYEKDMRAAAVAVNAHDALVAALESARAIIVGFEPEIGCIASDEELAKIDAALALARGEV